MKISIIFHNNPRIISGGLKVIYQYSNYLSEKGHEVVFYYMGNQILKNKLPEPIRRICTKVIVKFRPSWIKLNNKIKKVTVFEVNDNTISDADVIIATEVRTALPVSKLSNKKGKKNYFIQGFENWILPEKEVISTYSLGMNNITISKWLSKKIDLYAIKPSKCVPNYIDTDVFKVINDIQCRKKHTIAFHYRKSEVKGCNYAIETVRILEKKYPDLEVFVVGVEEKPRELPKSCRYFLNISPQEISKINNNVMIFMCSSIQEGFGLPGLEAMACGCVLVSTQYEAVSEYAEDGKNALLSPIRDSESMAANIVTLFEDDEIRVKLAKNAAKTAEKYCIDNSANKFEKVLKDSMME